jgi:hypothetical protein
MSDYEALDPYKHYRQYYGGMEAALINELAKMGTKPFQTERYRTAQRDLTASHARRQRDIARTFAGRGMLSSGPGRQAMLNARAAATRDATSLAKQRAEQQRAEAMTLLAQMLGGTRMPTQYVEKKDDGGILGAALGELAGALIPGFDWGRLAGGIGSMIT